MSHDLNESISKYCGTKGRVLKRKTKKFFKKFFRRLDFEILQKTFIVSLLSKPSIHYKSLTRFQFVNILHEKAFPAVEFSHL